MDIQEKWKQHYQDNRVADLTQSDRCQADKCCTPKPLCIHQAMDSLACPQLNGVLW